jgi:glucose-specific phosphotransferase system IIA component
MFTGITEPLEFSFLFVAPALFAVQVVLAGSAYMIAHILNIAVGLTFSGGLLDFFLFGILQGNEKTSWMLVIPVGIVYFLLYYFIFSFLIKKFNFKTPGREDDDIETKLYTKADVNARKAAKDVKSSDGKEAAAADELSQNISRGLGGKANISDVDCCATRLRITVIDPDKVNDALLKSTGASGVVHKGQGVQIIYGPRVTVIKSDLEDYLASVTEEHFEDDAAENNIAGTAEAKNENAASATDSNPASDKAQGSNVEKEPTSTVIISSPMTGIAADLSTAPDEAFASKMMGDGAVVTPGEGVVVAPEDGTVLFVFDTKHALGFTTDSGIGMIIHVGIDTVKLEGKGFDVQVEAGCHVNKGDVLMKLDLDYLKANAPSVTTPVICTELKDNQKIRLITDGAIKAGEPLYAVDTYEK